MRKVFSVLLISLFIGFAGCSNDDYKELTQEEIAQKIEELNNIYNEPAELDAEMMKLIDDGMATLEGEEYQEYLKKYVSPFQEKIKELGIRIRELEKELDYQKTSKSAFPSIVGRPKYRNQEAK